MKSKYLIIEKEVKEAGEMNPVIFDESKHVENPFENNMQRYRFFQWTPVIFPSGYHQILSWWINNNNSFLSAGGTQPNRSSSFNTRSQDGSKIEAPFKAGLDLIVCLYKAACYINTSAIIRIGISLMK